MGERYLRGPVLGNGGQFELALISVPLVRDCLYRGFKACCLREVAKGI